MINQTYTVVGGEKKEKKVFEDLLEKETVTTIHWETCCSKNKLKKIMKTRCFLLK